MHCGHAYDERNKAVERLLEAAQAFNVCMLNIYFQNNERDLFITYYSGDGRSMIHFVKMRGRNLKYVRD